MIGFITLLANFLLQIFTVYVLIDSLVKIKNVANDMKEVLVVNFKAIYLLISVYLVYLVSLILELFAWNDGKLSVGAFFAFNIIFQLFFTLMSIVLIYIFYKLW